jgi:hypothetical protein
MKKRKRNIHEKREKHKTKQNDKKWEKVPNCISKENEKNRKGKEKWGAKIATKVHQRDRQDG